MASAKLVVVIPVAMVVSCPATVDRQIGVGLGCCAAQGRGIRTGAKRVDREDLGAEYFTARTVEGRIGGVSLTGNAAAVRIGEAEGRIGGSIAEGSAAAVRIGDAGDRAGQGSTSPGGEQLRMQ